MKCIKAKDCKADTKWKTFQYTNMTRTDKAGQLFRSCWSSSAAILTRHQSWHFGLLALRNTCWGSAGFWAQVSSKYGTWYSERVILQFMCVGSLAGVTYLRYTVLMSSNKSETAVHCCDPALSVLVMLVSRNVFHTVSRVSALQSFAEIRDPQN